MNDHLFITAKVYRIKMHNLENWSELVIGKFLQKIVGKKCRENREGIGLGCFWEGEIIRISTIIS